MLIAFPAMTLQGMLSLQYLVGPGRLGFFLVAHHLFPKESSRWVFWRIEACWPVAFVAPGLGAGRWATPCWPRRLSFWVLPVRAVTFLYMMTWWWWPPCRAGQRADLPAGPQHLRRLPGHLRPDHQRGIRPQGMGLDLPAHGHAGRCCSHIVILAERWTLSIDAAEQTADDLRRLLDVNAAITSEMELEALLRKIVEVTSRIIHADPRPVPATPRPESCWSLVAEGLEPESSASPRTWAWPAPASPRASRSTSRDAYDDPRFHRDVDALTGYRTSSVLTIPVTARDGRKLGVMRALNRQNRAALRRRRRGAHGRLRRPGRHRHRQRHPLRRGGRRADLQREHPALDVDGRADPRRRRPHRQAERGRLPHPGRPGRAAGRRRRADVLLAANPALLDEFAAVSQSGQPKALVDADLVTARGDTISANLSIVPLVQRGRGRWASWS